MTGIYKKTLIVILKIVAVPVLVVIVVWVAFHVVGGDMVRTYQGPGIWGWLRNVYTGLDFGMAGEWARSGEPLAPYLWHAIGNTGAVAFVAILFASVFCFAWTYLAWNQPFSLAIRTGSVILRFFSSWPILIGAIVVAVIAKGQAFATILLPAFILATCDNNLNDFRDNLIDELRKVLKTDYALAVVGQGRSFMKNLAPEISWKILSFIGSRMPALVSGIIILELYFNINGIYVFLKMFYEARDLNAILGITFLVSLLLTAWSSAFALVHMLVDPRQR